MSVRNAECRVRSLWTIIAVAVSVLVAVAGVVAAQETHQEKDPFYPSEQRPSAAVPPPAGADWGRDPFSSPFGGKTIQPPQQGNQARARTLTGIIYGERLRLAIIGGETLREGSMVGGQKLVDIRKRSVVLKNPAGGLEEIFLEDFSIRK